MDYPFNNITPRAIKKKATNDTTSPSFLVFLSSEYIAIYIPFMNKKPPPNIIAYPNIFVSISKLKKFSKLISIFFEERYLSLQLITDTPYGVGIIQMVAVGDPLDRSRGKHYEK